MSGRRQFGSVRKLASGRWQARYRDGSGRMVTGPSTFSAKGDAARFLASIQTDMARGQFLDPKEGKISLTVWAEEWLDLPGKQSASVVRDRQGLAPFLDKLGSMPLSALTPKHVQAAVNARAKVAAPATVRRDFAALRAVLNAAVDADRIARSPARKVALPDVPRSQRDDLTPDGLAQLFNALPRHYRALVLTAAVLGLRWGEAVGLRVRDIDFMRRTVTVAQTVKELAGDIRIVPEAKTQGSLRTMVAPAFLVDELARHIAEHRGSPEADSDVLVFVGPRGGVLRRRFCERILRPTIQHIRDEDAKAKRKSIVPVGLNFHGLRVAAVTAMADAGVPFNVTQGRAGHTTARMTMEVYAHRTTDGDRSAAALLQAHFVGSFSGESGTDVARVTEGMGRSSA